jgi:hypothetical protein
VLKELQRGRDQEAREQIDRGERLNLEIERERKAKQLEIRLKLVKQDQQRREQERQAREEQERKEQQRRLNLAKQAILDHQAKQKTLQKEQTPQTQIEPTRQQSTNKTIVQAKNKSSKNLPKQPYTLWVGNLPANVTEEELRTLFQVCDFLLVLLTYY